MSPSSDNLSNREDYMREIDGIGYNISNTFLFPFTRIRYNLFRTKKYNEESCKKISASKYKLSCFDFNIESIAKIVNMYNNNCGYREKKIKTSYLGMIEKILLNDPNYRFTLDGNILFDVKLHEKATKSNFSFYKLKNAIQRIREPGKKLKEYGCPERYKDKKYIGDNLGFEDFWSLCLMELLQEKGRQAFFGSRTLGGKTRELADVIDIHAFKDGLNIDLYHMKLKPFEQQSISVIEAVFSHYTEAVGQILEKAKALLYTGKFESILDGLEGYFLDGSSPGSNYEIFEALKNAINKNKNNHINFNFYFPVQEKDYFNYKKLDGNNLKKLGLETNWKRLKIISEVFSANLSSVNPDMKVHLHLGLVICKGIPTNLGNKHIKTKITLLHNIEKLFQ